MNTSFLGLHVPNDATGDREPGSTVADSMTGAGALAAVLAVAANGTPRLRAGHTLPALQSGTRALTARGSLALSELRAAVGFILGLVAVAIAVIVLLTYWYVHSVRNRRA